MFYCCSFFLMKKTALDINMEEVLPFNKQKWDTLGYLVGIELNNEWLLFVYSISNTSHGSDSNYVYFLFRETTFSITDFYFIISDTHLPISRIIKIEDSRTVYDFIEANYHFETKGYIPEYLVNCMQHTISKRESFDMFSFLEDSIGINIEELSKSDNELFCIPFDILKGDNKVCSANIISYQETQIEHHNLPVEGEDVPFF